MNKSFMMSLGLVILIITQQACSTPPPKPPVLPTPKGIDTAVVVCNQELHQWAVKVGDNKYLGRTWVAFVKKAYEEENILYYPLLDYPANQIVPLGQEKEFDSDISAREVASQYNLNLAYRAKEHKYINCDSLK